MEPLFNKRKFSTLAFVGLALALIAALLALVSGPGVNMGWWHFRSGFMLLRWSVYIAIAALIISLLGLFVARPGKNKKGFTEALMGGVISTLIIVIPVMWQQTARSVPPIHDITTDVDNPPQFSTISEIRGDAANSLEYQGAEIALQQQQTYPEIKPLVLNAPQQKVFDAAIEVTQQLNWDIYLQDRSTYKIEATDTTFWFGFKDDVIVRITAFDQGSKVDVRSVSRVGKSDVGTNAKRILKFLNELQKKIKTN